MAGIADSLRATLTTRGDLPIQGAADVGRLALGSVGSVLTSDGTDALWLPGQRISVVNDAGRSYSNSTAATSVLSGGAAIAGAYQAASVGDLWEIDFGGTWLNNSGAPQTLTINVTHGNANIVGVVTASVAASATARKFSGSLVMSPKLTIGSLGQVYYRGYVALNTASTANFDNLQASASTFWTGGGIASSYDPATAQSFNITTTMSTASTLATVTLQWANLRFIPKGA